MSKKRYISDYIWNDSWFENQSAEKKLIFIYLITNKLVSICGFYEITTRQIAFDTDIDKSLTEKYLIDFEKDGKVFYRNGIICIINFVKNQNVNSIEDNLWKGIVREIKELGQKKLDLLLKIEGVQRGLQGAYKDVPIHYLTLLNFTSLDLKDTPNKKHKNVPKGTELSLKPITLEINNLIQELKDTADNLGLAYNKKNERNFANHILTAKEFATFCQKIGQSPIEFAKNIMIASEKIGFWRGVCSGPASIYEHYAEVYNQTKKKSDTIKGSEIINIT